MKKLKYLLLTFLILSFLRCKEQPELSTSLKVETYVNQLKTNSFDSSAIPAFTKEDIPALLAHRYDVQPIKNFPVNPISSYYLEECTLGNYILWTIESIRLRSLKGEELIQGFPSANPVLQSKNDTATPLPLDETAQLAAAEAYYDWWMENRTRELEDFHASNPLEGTVYSWF